MPAGTAAAAAAGAGTMQAAAAATVLQALVPLGCVQPQPGGLPAGHVSFAVALQQLPTVRWCSWRSGQPHPQASDKRMCTRHHQVDFSVAILGVVEAGLGAVLCCAVCAFGRVAFGAAVVLYVDIYLSDVLAVSAI